ELVEQAILLETELPLQPSLGLRSELAVDDDLAESALHLADCLLAELAVHHDLVPALSGGSGWEDRVGDGDGVAEERTGPVGVALEPEPTPLQLERSDRDVPPESTARVVDRLDLAVLLECDVSHVLVPDPDIAPVQDGAVWSRLESATPDCACSL